MDFHNIDFHLFRLQFEFHVCLFVVLLLFLLLLFVLVFKYLSVLA